MSHALDDARAKIGRAEEHLEALKSEARTFLNGHPYAFFEQIDPETSGHVFRCAHAQRPPSRMGIIAGDVVHNLRCALDFTVWRMALSFAAFTGRAPLEREVQFPIADCRRLFLKSAVVCNSWVSARDRAVIEEFQPYKGTDGHKRHPLFFLRELSNSDKHRILNGVIVTLSDSPHFTGRDGTTILDQWHAQGCRLEEGAKVACVSAKAPDGVHPGVDMDHLPVGIGFGDVACDIEQFDRIKSTVERFVIGCWNMFPDDE